jgi:voltage-gated sodium channel
MLQKLFRKISNSLWFQYLIVSTIIFSCILVFLETWDGLKTDITYYHLDWLITIIFTIEAIIKIGAEGRSPHHYFRNGWNVFDFIVVIVCYIPGIAFLRVFRVLRLMSVIQKLKLWVEALLRSLPTIAYVFLILCILFFTYGVIGVYLFSETDAFHFGNLKNSLISLLRIITLEDWTDILYQNIYKWYPTSDHEYYNNPVGRKVDAVAMIYFVSFIIACVFVLLNMFTGVIVNAIQETKVELDKVAEKQRIEAIIGDKSEVINDIPNISADDVDALEQQLAELQLSLNDFRSNLTTIDK